MNSAYSGGLTLLRLGLGVLSIPLLIRGLGLTTYGAWVVMLAIINFTSVLYLGFSAGFSVHLAEAEASGGNYDFKGLLKESLLLISGCGLLSGLAIVLSARWLHDVLFRSLSPKEASETLLVLSATAVLLAVKHWAVMLEAGMLRYDLQARAEAISSTLQYSGWIALAIHGTTPLALALWYLLSVLVGSLLHLKGVITLMQGRWKNSPSSESYLRTMIRFGLAQSASQLGGTFFNQFDRIVVSFVAGPRSAGIYAALTAVVAQINVLSAAPIQVIVTAIGSAEKKADKLRIFRAGSNINDVLASALAVSVIVLAEPIVKIVVPEAHPDGVVLLRVLSIAYGAYSLAASGYYAAQGLRRPKINARWQIFSGIMSLLFIFVFTEFFGLLGAVWGNLAYGVVLGTNYEVGRVLGGAVREFWDLLGLSIGSVVASFALNQFLNNPGSQLSVKALVAGLQGVVLIIVFVRTVKKYRLLTYSTWGAVQMENGRTI